MFVHQVQDTWVILDLTLSQWLERILAGRAARSRKQTIAHRCMLQFTTTIRHVSTKIVEESLSTSCEIVVSIPKRTDHSLVACWIRSNEWEHLYSRRTQPSVDSRRTCLSRASIESVSHLNCQRSHNRQNLDWHRYYAQSAVYIQYCDQHIVCAHCGPSRDLFTSHSLHASISASKQYLHVQLLSDYGIQLPLLATHDNIDSLRIFMGLDGWEMAMALRSTEYIGYGHPLQSGPCFVPSLLRNRVSSEDIFPIETVDGRVFL